MRHIKLDDFTKFKFLSSLCFSPDGEKACYVVTESNVEDNGYKANLWIHDINKSCGYQLTSCNKESSYTWLKDSKTILFPSMRDEKDRKAIEGGDEFTQYYKININGGEAVKSFRIPRMVTSIQQVDDDTFLLTAIHKIGMKDLSNLSKEEKEKELSERKEERDYEVLDEIPFWSNGEGFTNGKRNGLYRYTVSSGTLNLITDEYMSVGQVSLSPQKDKAVFTASAFKNKAALNDELYIYDIKNNSLSQLNKGLFFSYGCVQFMDKDTLIAIGSDMKTYGINEDGKFYLIDIPSSKMTILTPNFDKSVWNSVGSDCRYGGGKNFLVDGKYFYFITTEIDSSYINRIDKEGHMEKITEEKGSVDFYDVKNGKVLMAAMRDQKLQELYEVSYKKETQLTFFNEWVQKELKVAKPEPLNFMAAKDVQIEGWVLKPVDFDPSKKYPAILDVHGGPKVVYGTIYYHEMQYWANKGYFVFFCNPRGGDAHGREFADIRGKYGTIDYEDLMTFTDKVLEAYPNIDAANVGVTGGSYGGFMTNWIIGHTDRFKAAASQRSISNWISKFCTTDIGYYFVEDQQQATPWNNPEKLWDFSPLKYADRVKTPTLFINSNEDYRCWMAEGLQMFTALKYNGVEARLCLFRGETHELSRSGKPKHRIRRLVEITNWFDGHLK